MMTNFEKFINEYKESKITTVSYILFHILSIGLFHFYWLGHVRVHFRKYLKKEVITSRLFLFFIAAEGLGLWIVIMEEGYVLDYISSILVIIAWIIQIIISFNISKEISIKLTEEEIKLPQQTSFNSLWIILFTFFYINYKLNQFLELEEKTK